MADKEDPVATRSSSPKLYYIKEARAKSVPQELSAGQDLMTTFNLLPLYNCYVKQKLENNEAAPAIALDYFPYISDLPGRNTIRQGNYIRTLLETPEKTYGPIHAFSSSTIRDSFSFRPGPVPGFDPTVLGTEEDGVRPVRQGQVQSGVQDAYTQGSSVPGSGQMHGVPVYDAAGLAPSLESPAHSSGHHHHSHHHHSHSKSSTSSPHVERAERGEDGEREHRHKKKKKKRKHEHDHEHSHHDGGADSEHRKKKKRKKEREDQADVGDIVY
ncbi:hypothetical protein BGZ74_005124 [Mortierella antarctica]|nr:hypothetical protein BGZ74_005124 [Mortierella antarctica]